MIQIHLIFTLKSSSVGLSKNSWNMKENKHIDEKESKEIETQWFLMTTVTGTNNQIMCFS